jgi:hypothetical protein
MTALSTLGLALILNPSVGSWHKSRHTHQNTKKKGLLWSEQPFVT